MSLSKTLARVLPRKSLGLQLCLPTVLLLMPTAGFLAWFAITTLANEQRDAVTNKAVHIGETFRALPQSVAGKANPDIEQFLLFAADHPVKQIAVINELGNSVVTAIKPASGKAYLNEATQKFHPPTSNSAVTNISHAEAAYWLPINGVNHEKYWLSIRASFQDINRWEQDKLFISFAALAILFGVLTPLLLLNAQKTQKTLRAAAEFANAISANPNSELLAHAGNEDLDNLIGALNRLSKNWHHRLHISEQNAAYLRMHKVAIDLHSAVCITNGNGRIEYVNKHFCIASGYEEKELVGKNISVLNSGYHEEYYFKNLWRTLAVGRVWQGDLCNLNKRGEPYWVKCTIAPIKDQAGRLCQYIAVQTPVSHAQDMGYAAGMQ